MKKSYIFLLLLLLVLAPMAHGQQIDYKPDKFWKINYSATIQASGAPNAYGDQLQTTTQDKWNDMLNNANWNTQYKFKSVTDIIRVGIDHDNPVIIAANYKYRIDLQIKGYATPGGALQTKNVSLVIEYNKDSLQPYNDLSTFKLDGAGFHSFDTKLMNIVDLTQPTPATVPRASLAKNFYIETDVIVERYDLAPGTLRVYSNHTSDPDNIDVWWHFEANPTNPVNCTEQTPDFSSTVKPVMYELEWTFVDNYGYNLTTHSSVNLNPTQVPYDFRNNSTRVITNDAHYKIPKIYEKGFIIFRVRSIRPNPNNYSKLIYSAWTLPDYGNAATNSTNCAWRYMQAMTPYNDDKFNWQYTISFAEEGKHKGVINYFDGAGYNRQTQTKINSDPDYTIVADKIYDFEGRPAIQTLPIPVWSGDLKYKPDLSINKSTSQPYKAADFDRGCMQDSIVPFKETSLAALYYSPSNPHKEGMQKFVPDAKGYPFMETVFSPDNTNKVLWQGGAGVDMQRWKGHGTRYAYVRAGQPEINHLMGTEAGYYEYYPKQVVIDPNQQASFSIFNPRGKVVATALAGASPADTAYPIQALSNITTPTTVTTELLAGMDQDVSNGRRTAEHNFFAEAAGTNKWKYAAVIPAYNPACGNEFLKIKANYSVKVVNDCGTVMAEQSGLIGDGNVIATNNTPFHFTGTEFSAQLSPDKYTIVKELYFPDTSMYRLSEAFVNNHIGYTDCYLTADSFIRKNVEAATFPCTSSDTPTSCDILKRKMLDELYPGAKYGQYVVNGSGGFGGEVTGNSIFSRVTSEGNVVPNIWPGLWSGLQNGFPVAEAELGNLQFIATYVSLEALNHPENLVFAADSSHPHAAFSTSFGLVMRVSDFVSPTVIQRILKDSRKIPPPGVDNNTLLLLSLKSELVKSIDSIREAPQNDDQHVYAAGAYVYQEITDYDLGGGGGIIVIPGPIPVDPPSNPQLTCRWAVHYGYVDADLNDGPGGSGGGGGSEGGGFPVLEQMNDYANNYGGSTTPVQLCQVYDTIWLASGDTPPDHRSVMCDNVPESLTLLSSELLGCSDTSVHIDTFYRYQAPCIDSSITVSIPHTSTATINGVPTTITLYTEVPITHLTPDQLILYFNDDVAEALLPLHPEYCKLQFCETGDFETRLENTDSFAEASALGLSSLSGLLNHDPLSPLVDASAPFTTQQLSYFDIDATITGANAGLVRRIDTLAMERAYCDCNSPEPYMYCKMAEYQYQINHMQMPNADIKNRFFRNLKELYLGNRNMRKQQAMDMAGDACGPCAEWRMHLTGSPVFPSLTDAAGTGPGQQLNNDSDYQSWMGDVIADGINGNTAGLSQVPAGLTQTYNILQQQQDTEQVSRIMTSLQNCGLGYYQYYDVKIALTALAMQKGGANITPDDLQSILLANGVALSDLCNAFLVEYGIFDSKKYKPKGDYVNKSTAFYDGLKSFLNRYQIQSILSTVFGSSATINLQISTNPFEAELASVIGVTSETQNVTVAASYNVMTLAQTTQGSATQPYFKISVTYGSNSDTIFLSPRNLNPPPYVMGQPEYTSDLSPLYNVQQTAIQDFSDCHTPKDDSLVSTLGKGYIAPNLVFMTYNKVIIDANNAAHRLYNYYNVWSHKIKLLKDKDPEAPDYCISCIAMKNAVDSYYHAAPVYALPVFTNDPDFEDAFTNFMNYRFGTRHSFDEYERLMKGCALSDKILFPKAQATVQITFPLLINADSYLSNLQNSFPDINISHFLIQKSNGNVVAWFDLNSVPKQSLRSVRSYLMNGSGALYPMGATAEVFVKASCPAPSISNATVASEPVTLLNFDGTYNSYKHYSISATSSTPLTVSNVLQQVKDYYNTAACTAAYMVTNAQLYRSDDYGNPVKEDYLDYVYNSIGYMEDEDVLANIAPSVLKQQIPSLAASSLLLSYNDDWCNNVKEDLYYYTNPAATQPGWKRLTDILTKVKATLGSSKLFPASAPATTIALGTGSTLGSSLIAYKMSNGGVWYRLFGPQAKLYNVYLYPSDHMITDAANYTMVAGTTAAPNPVAVQGADSLYRFKVRMKNGSQYVDCYGYTDFPIGSGSKLENVVLYDNQNNYQCVDTMPCERSVMLTAVEQGELQHQVYVDSVINSHFLAMKQFFPKYSSDSLYFTTQQQQYQYTLYYYDLEGNLERTVPPAGVHPMQYSQDASINNARNSTNATTQQSLKAANTKVSTYKYNSLDQLVWQQTPDGGITEFFYDPAGRLVFSQNAHQRPNKKYSYTLYDDQSRIIETGAFVCDPSLPVGQHPAQITNAPNTQMSFIIAMVHTKAREDVVATVYDHPLLNLETFPGLSAQENLRKRVSAILYAPYVATSNTIEAYYSYATHFSYDAMGNVSVLVHDNPYMDYMGQRFKRIDYTYDLLSGKVDMLSYDRGRADQIYHRYEYDADNRITTAYTSKDGLSWDRDAAYEYYKHGPLAAVHIGDLQVQSVQYAYTIQGWLKAINGDALNPASDMGQDGISGGAYPKDVVSHALDYYAGDYKPIGTTQVMHTPAGDAISRSLYNGNIVRQTTGMAGMANLQRDYQYDQLNRIKQTVYSSMDNITHAVTAMGNAFKNTYAYDPDGNITTLTRNNTSGTAIDNFTYHYYAATNNKLSYVTDAAAGGNGSDLQPGQASGNYNYDEIGNLITDKQEGIKTIDWNLYGKVSHIAKGTATEDTMNLYFSYDGAGNRIRKDYIHATETPGIEERVSDIYVRDASGNILAVYKSKSQLDGDAIIDWVNNDIISQDGGSWVTPQGWGIGPFLAQQFGGNGSFTDHLFQVALHDYHPWAAEQIDHPLNYYLTHSADLLHQAVGIGLGNYYTPLGAYNEGRIWIDLLKKKNNVNAAPLLTVVWDPRTPVSQQARYMLPETNPKLCVDLLAGFGIEMSVEEAPDKLENALHSVIDKNGPGKVADAFRGIAAPTGPDAPDAYYKKLMQDETVGNWLRAKDQASLLMTLQRDLDEDGTTREDQVDFFSDWIPGYNPDWLNRTASEKDRLNIVFDVDRTGFIVNYLDGIGIQAVNQSLHGIPNLTGTGYLGLIPIAINNGTLNPNYQPPTVNTPDPGNLLGENMYLAEHHLYGSSRLGIKYYDTAAYRQVYANGSGVGLTDTSISKRVPWYSFAQQDWIKADKASEFTSATYNRSTDTLREQRELGMKQYEMNDHLGNVLATVLDRKTGYGNSSGNYTGFSADVASVTDYYPGGFEMSERSITAENLNPFRFGSQKQEKDNEVYGDGNSYAFKYRMNDARLNRLWSVDPLAAQYPWNSSYAFSENRLIDGVEMEGKEWYYAMDGTYLGRYGSSNNVMLVNSKFIDAMAANDFTVTQALSNINQGVAKDPTHAIDAINSQSKYLGISNNTLLTRAATAYAESSVGYGIEDFKEVYAISSVHLKNKIAFGATAPLATTFLNTNAEDRNGNFMQTAIAGAINAARGGIDYSNGADQWDGAEQAMVSKINMNKPSNGRFMFKMNVMGWSMSDKDYSSWKEAVNKRFGNGRFTVPQKKTAVFNYGGMKNKDKIRLNSTAQYGLSIFWKTTK